MEIPVFGPFFRKLQGSLTMLSPIFKKICGTPLPLGHLPGGNPSTFFWDSVRTWSNCPVTSQTLCPEGGLNPPHPPPESFRYSTSLVKTKYIHVSSGHEKCRFGTSTAEIHKKLNTPLSVFRLCALLALHAPAISLFYRTAQPRPTGCVVSALGRALLAPTSHVNVRDLIIGHAGRAVVAWLGESKTGLWGKSSMCKPKISSM